MLNRWIDHNRHPISDVAWRSQCRQRFERDGALVLHGFFTDALLHTVMAEVDGREDEAFYASSTHNVWLTDADETLPPGHVFNRQVVSSKGLLADDQVAAGSPLRTVYDDPAFRSFIAEVVKVAEVYPYADPLSSINVHFHRDGEELGWHFDNSGFAVTALIQAPASGGHFEFVANLRHAATGDQNFEGVEAVLDGHHAVDTLSFDPGDLVLFRGRDSLHRVTPSAGETTRVLVVFAFNEAPGIALSDSAKRTFYGRVS